MDRVMMQRVPHMCGAGGASVVCAIQFPTKIAPKNKFPTKNTAPTRPAHAPTRAIHSCWLKRAVAEREANRALQHTPKQASTLTDSLPRAERRAGLQKRKERKKGEQGPRASEAACKYGCCWRRQWRGSEAHRAGTLQGGGDARAPGQAHPGLRRARRRRPLHEVLPLVSAR